MDRTTIYIVSAEPISLTERLSIQFKYEADHVVIVHSIDELPESHQRALLEHVQLHEPVPKPDLPNVEQLVDEITHYRLAKLPLAVTRKESGFKPKGFSKRGVNKALNRIF